jgi:DNA replication and repair protein RecF
VRVGKLSTAHFRNLHHPEISFAPGVNLFVGENGQGKTNLLEAVFLFKFGRSFRTHRDTEMIQFGQRYCRASVSCEYADGHVEEFSASVERSGEKRIKIAAEPIERLSELIGRYPIVLFGPQDIRLTTGQPADRRRFFDSVGSMTDPAYMGLLKEYRRILNQRNAALKARASSRERDAWNGELVDKGCKLILKRLALTAVLERHLLDHAADLNAPFEFTLSYESAVVRESAEAAGNGEDPGPDDVRAVFDTRLLALEEEELRRGTTLAGPHRDDVSIKLAGHDVRKYGSQGQRRLIAVLLKLAELSHLESELKEPCVLLLDDVFSEFDPRITGRLQGLLESGRQVLVTSPGPLEWVSSHDVKQFKVWGGGVAADIAKA